MTSSPLLSIVSPVYGAAEIVPVLVERISASALTVTDDFEIILVEDGSPDDSWLRISALCATAPRVKGIRLTRNFGQQNAITAGLAHARGAYVVVMDCDLQDDPRYIPALLAKAREGCDVVLTQKQDRGYNWLRRGLTRVYYALMRVTGDLPHVNARINGYSLLSRRVVEAYLRLADYRRDFLMLVLWMGFRHAVVPVEHAPRFAGKSSYTWTKLLQHGLATITAHSKVLLKISIAIGFAYVAAAFFATVYLIVSYYIHGYRAGWASTMVLLLASTGLILLAIGIAGIYIGNIFDQVRGRPLFLVQETINLAPPAKQPAAGAP